MKTTVLIVAIIALAIVFVACKRASTGQLSDQPDLVVFPDAAVSLDVGTGWQRIDASPGLPVCPPTLAGSAGMVRALLFAPSIANMQAAASAVRSMFDRNSDAVKDSYRQEAFKTDSGLEGQHISYDVRTEKEGVTTEVRSHNFVVQRLDGRCLSISYITTTTSKNSDDVRRLIQKSLKLQ